jgi:hypothetical protein
MISNTALSFPISSELVRQPLSVAAAGSLSDSTAPKAALWRELCSFAVDALDLRSWRRANPMACIMLAGFVAIVAEPLVHNGFAARFLALMTSAK